VSNIVSHNEITGLPYSNHHGGGITFTNTTGDLTNNLIVENTCLQEIGRGGGLAIHSSFIDIHNTTIANNEASQCYQVYINIGSFANVYNSIIWPEGLSFTQYMSFNYSLTYYLQSGPGNFAGDPLFVGNGDYHLTHQSPCRNTGDNNSVPGYLDNDLDGDPRIHQRTVDMGADEFNTHLYWTGNATPGGNVDIKLVGLPGTAPVYFCIGFGVLDPPIPSMWGDWYLKFPILGPVDLGTIPSPDGVMIYPSIIPGTSPAPYSIPMQALIGDELTNLCILNII
jgi:hypothetical protein